MALRLGAAHIVAHRRSFAVLTGVMVAIGVGLYAVVTLGNSLVFGYNFFNTPAPSNTANTVAVVSLWVLAVAEAAAGTLMFGAFCALSIAPHSVSAALRASLRSLKRDAWWAVPAWVATAISAAIVFPGPLLVGPFSALAVARIGAQPRRFYVRRVIGPQLVIGLVASGTALAIWISAGLMSQWKSAPEAVWAVVGISWALLALMIPGWTAAASAQLYLHDLQAPMWPSPSVAGLTPTGDRPRYRSPGVHGLVLFGDRLWYRPSRDQLRSAGLALEPDGVVLFDDLGARRVLAWPEQASTHGAWELHGRMATRYSRPGIAVWPDGAGTYGVASREVWLPTWGQAPVWELPALVAYLKRTPAARGGLADATRLRRLVFELATGDWRHPGPAPEPMAGDRLDVWFAIGRSLDLCGWNRIQGHPVRGEVAPDPESVVERARTLLSADVSTRVDDTHLRRELDRHLLVGEWPFDVLLQG